ncbi:hypothetical protein SDC9_100317 [bioreactor metagenome]|uniref:Uncharacterized protein n=1 Tax=bioreactor metagenome TaxID=1076179 RepID=A0A645AK62_9ZZZZ
MNANRREESLSLLGYFKGFLAACFIGANNQTQNEALFFGFLPVILPGLFCNQSGVLFFAKKIIYLSTQKWLQIIMEVRINQFHKEVKRGKSPVSKLLTGLLEKCC